MAEVLTWAVIYMGTIAIGYALKQMGIFGEETKKAISSLIFYVTLPALLVSSFSEAEANLWYLVSIFLGMGVNFLMVVMSVIVTRNKSDELKGIYTINGAGFNMGNLAIPFLSGFYPAGIPYLCMFDVGDSFFTLGTTYAIASLRMGRQAGSPVRSILKTLVLSVSFDTYIIMTILSFLHVKLPEQVITFADFLGKGNGCLAMLLIGISLNFSMSRQNLKEALLIVGERYLCGVIAAVVIFCVLPAPMVMRQILAVAIFAAAPSVALIFTMKLGVSAEIPGIVATVSAVCMIPVMAAAMCVVGV